MRGVAFARCEDHLRRRTRRLICDWGTGSKERDLWTAPEGVPGGLASKAAATGRVLGVLSRVMLNGKVLHRWRRFAAVAVMIYAVFLVTAEFEHHDLACHFKTPFH